MKKEDLIGDKTYIAILFLLFLTIFAVIQNMSLAPVADLLSRDSQTNSFKEIDILKDKNQDLRDEVNELEGTLSQLSNQNEALGAIDDQIKKYQKLSGESPIFGPGISISIDSELEIAWAIDLINDFFNSGAQAVSINNLRITNRTIGFEVLPNKNLLLYGSVLRAPYEFNLIGEPADLEKILTLPGGIISRYKASFPQAKVEINRKEVIKMD